MSALGDMLRDARANLGPVQFGPGRPHYHHAFPHGSACYCVEADWIASWAEWAGQCVPGHHTCQPILDAWLKSQGLAACDTPE